MDWRLAIAGHDGPLASILMRLLPRFRFYFLCDIWDAVIISRSWATFRRLSQDAMSSYNIFSR